VQVVYINKIETNARWGAEYFQNKAFIKTGVNTICIDYQKAAYNLSAKVNEASSRGNALILQRGTGYLPPKCIFRSVGIPKILILTELIRRVKNQYYLLDNRLFDYIFVRSVECLHLLRQRFRFPAERSSLLLSAVDPALYYPITTEKDIDVLFIGTVTPRRNKILAELKKNVSVNIENVYGREANKLFNRAKVILNIHGGNYADTETRIFEVLAGKGFLVTEKLSSESPFKSGRHLTEVDSVPEMVQMTDFYLNSAKQREIIAKNGYDFVIASHTYLHRSYQIQTVLEELLQIPAESKPNSSFVNFPCFMIEKLQWIKDSAFNTMLNTYHHLRT